MHHWWPIQLPATSIQLHILHHARGNFTLRLARKNKRKTRDEKESKDKAVNAQVKFWQRYKCNGKLVIYNENSEFGHSNNYNIIGYNFTTKHTHTHTILGDCLRHQKNYIHAHAHQIITYYVRHCYSQKKSFMGVCVRVWERERERELHLLSFFVLCLACLIKKN